MEEKEFEGYVSEDEEYGYIGVGMTDVANIVESMLSQYKRKRVKVSVTIVEIEDEEDDED